MSIINTFDVGYIGILSCFEPEWAALTARITEPTEIRINGLTFVTGTMADKPVVAVMSGMSMVNAAMTSQLMLSRFSVSALIVSGIGGGLDPELNIGDVIIPAQWAQSLEVIMGRQGVESVTAPKWLTWATALKPYGMMIPNQVVVGNADAPAMPKLWFQCNEHLLETARKIETLELHYKTTKGIALSHPPKVHIGGNGISSSAFIDNADYRTYVHEVFGAQIADMESAAVGQVAFANSVPYIVFRSVSDLAGGSNHDNEMATFMELASENAAMIVEVFISKLYSKMPKSEIGFGQ